MTERPYRRTGENLMCPVCGAAFYRKRAEVRVVNYCSVRCSTKANFTMKPPAKGERRARGTEFQPGTTPHNHARTGTVRVRQRTNRVDAPRAWVKVSEPNVWVSRAVLVYEQAHGEIPRGKVIHHIDHDSLNDAVDNLVALTRAEHAAIHAGTPSNMSS